MLVPFNVLNGPKEGKVHLMTGKTNKMKFLVEVWLAISRMSIHQPSQRLEDGPRMWKQIFGLNIYEMGNRYLLFEFASKAAAEQVMDGEWFWKQLRIRFQWWSPTVGAIEEKANPNSTRIVGLPLYLWS